MVGKIEAWGDSLGVRIPHVVAEQARLAAGCNVTITLENGRLVVAPEPLTVFRLEELLAAVTPENIHCETDWGPLLPDYESRERLSV